MKSMKGKAILITGASSGIGEASAEQFATLGANIIITARRKDRIEDLARNMTSKFGVKVLAIPLDVRNRKQVEECISGLPYSWRNIDVLVNNAGLALDLLPLQKGIIEHWDTMISTNIQGLLYMTHAVLQGMIERNSGHIINISSIAGHEHYPGGNVYSATKHAVRALSKSLRLDLLGSPIRVSDVAPGAAATEFSEVRWNDKERADKFYQEFEALTAEDVADAVVYCATRPAHVNIDELVVMPTCQASANHISRYTDKN